MSLLGSNCREARAGASREGLFSAFNFLYPFRGINNTFFKDTLEIVTGNCIVFLTLSLMCFELFPDFFTIINPMPTFNCLQVANSVACCCVEGMQDNL